MAMGSPVAGKRDGVCVCYYSDVRGARKFYALEDRESERFGEERGRIAVVRIGGVVNALRNLLHMPIIVVGPS